ncbi:unnamed protein product [Heterobilharzia americana]|nr:unnamed protein product [Heterobilharzia americana]
MCGTIELASGGIAFFPNLELYKKKELTNLIYALENMTVGVSTSEHETKSPIIHEVVDELRYPNETTIWASAEVNPANRKKLKESALKCSQNDLFVVDYFLETIERNWTCSSLLRKGNLREITHAFDLVVDTEVAAGPIEVVDRSLANFCFATHGEFRLEEASSRIPQLSDMKIYTSLLDACRNAPPVKIDENTSQLLKVYYLAMRRLSIQDQQTAPASALPTLFKLAKANAKINGRIVGKEVDAIVAIYIYDTFIEHQTGRNYLGSKSFHYVPGMQQDSMEELNATLILISKQLKDLISVAVDEL